MSDAAAASQVRSVQLELSEHGTETVSLVPPARLLDFVPPPSQKENRLENTSFSSEYGYGRAYGSSVPQSRQPAVIPAKVSGIEWMPAPTVGDSDNNVPPGLEYLTLLDRVLVQQCMEVRDG